MIYILVALKAEAQAFVDRYKLINYKNEVIKIIITGIGSKNMYDSTINIVKNLKKNDKIINIGICGANKKYKIGQLINGFKENITCVDFEVSNNANYNIVDMESSGFIEATKDIKDVYMYKIVSDHFEPRTIKKDKAKKLIFDKIDNIMKEVNENSSCNWS